MFVIVVLNLLAVACSGVCVYVCPRMHIVWFLMTSVSSVQTGWRMQFSVIFENIVLELDEFKFLDLPVIKLKTLGKLFN